MLATLSRRRVFGLPMVFGLALAASAPGAAVASTDATCAAKVTVRVTGAVKKPLRLCPADLKAFKAFSVSVTTGGHTGTDKRSYRGPALLDVLDKAGLRTDAAVDGDRLRFVVKVVSSDGYAATLSWGELEPKLARTRVLLSTVRDGEKLKTPELVVPADKKGSRWVRDVAEIRVVRV